MRYLVSMVLVFCLMGCGTSIRDNWDENEGVRSAKEGIQQTTTPKYGFYVGASISTTLANGEQTYESGIYGSSKADGALTKFLDLDGKDRLIDSFAVDAQGNIYWTDRSVHGIFVADRNGNNRRLLLSGLDIPFGIVLDEEHGRLYWSNWLQSQSPQKGEVGYISLSDGKAVRIVTEGLQSGGHLLIDTVRNRLYIADLMGGKILSVALDGGALQTVVDINHASAPEQMALDATGKSLFWADIAEDKIAKVDLETLVVQDLDTFNDAFANPEALTYDKKTNKLYFVTMENGQSVLWRMNPDGSNKESVNTTLPKAIFKIILR